MQKANQFTVKTKMWIYEGDNPWHFATIGKSISREIKKFETWPKRGFGSIPVKTTVGKTTWLTSVFPEKSGVYLLPIKKDVRVKENLKIGKIIKLQLELLI